MAAGNLGGLSYTHQALIILKNTVFEGKTKQATESSLPCPWITMLQTRQREECYLRGSAGKQPYPDSKGSLSQTSGQILSCKGEAPCDHGGWEQGCVLPPVPGGGRALDFVLTISS